MEKSDFTEPVGVVRLPRGKRIDIFLHRAPSADAAMIERRLTGWWEQQKGETI